MTCTKRAPTGGQAVRRSGPRAAPLAGRPGGFPNVDLALAAVVHAHGLRPDAGEAIFAVARTVGWIAHALEEYAEPGLRFRAEGVYTGRYRTEAASRRCADLPVNLSHPIEGNSAAPGDVSPARPDMRISVTVRLRGVADERRGQ